MFPSKDTRFITFQWDSSFFVLHSQWKVFFLPSTVTQQQQRSIIPFRMTPEEQEIVYTCQVAPIFLTRCSYQTP